MEFYIGYTTNLDEKGLYPEGFVDYCNTHGYIIKDNGDRTYTISEPVSEPLPFLEQKQNKINLMNSTYEQYISVISTETDEDKASYIVPQTEVATFDMQKLEAEAWQIDNSVATPFIDGIALGRQMDRVLLIQKVLAKAMGYSQYVSVLTGKRQHIEDLLKQAHTQEELDAIDIEALYN